jgi:hypothetical protein
MEEIKWFSSVMVGVLAAIILGFGLVLAEICQTFGQLSVTWHVNSEISHTEPS